MAAMKAEMNLLTELHCEIHLRATPKVFQHRPPRLLICSKKKLQQTGHTMSSIIYKLIVKAAEITHLCENIFYLMSWLQVSY